MKQASQIELKTFLRDACLPALSKEAPYFPLGEIRRFLVKRGVPFKDSTLNRYLHDFTASAFIYDAGRGWYSRLALPFELDASAIHDLAGDLERAFPLVNFTCWSTAEIQGGTHHLLGSFVAFVMVEGDAMDAVYGHLRDSGWDAHLNPRGKDAARFSPRKRSVVIRRSSVKNRARDHVAPIENLLVELYFESRDLGFMATDEYHAMLANLAGTRRINMATLLSYARERKLQPGLLFRPDDQLIPPMIIRRN